MWALYSFLESGMDGALTAGFSTFRAALDGGTEEPHAAVFEREVGGLQALEAPLLEWLRGAQLPMWPVYLEWTHLRPDALWGHGANFTYALFRDPLAALSAEVRPAVAPWGLGLVIEYLDAGNYTGVVLFDEGGVSTFEVRDGSAIWWDQGQAVLPEMDDGLTVSVERGSGGMATVRFGESSFEFATTMPPILGLAVNDSDVRFEALRWRAVAE